MAKRTPINGAKYRNAPQALVDRILAKRLITADGCWLWTGDTSHDGYGDAKYRDHGKRPHVYVHRLIYMRLVADPGDLLELDHLCHDPDACKVPGSECPHRRCFNPAHLKVSTRDENNLRSGSISGINAAKDKCDKGHEFTEANTYIKPSNGSRSCRECHRLEAAVKRTEESSGERAGRLQAATVKRHALRSAEVRSCSICGAGILHRSRRSVYCETCAGDMSSVARALKKQVRAAA